MSLQQQNNESTEARKIGEIDEETKETNIDVDSRETYEYEDEPPVYKSEDENSAGVTPANNELNQSSLTKGYTDMMHADNDTDKNEYEEDLELKK